MRGAAPTLSERVGSTGLTMVEVLVVLAVASLLLAAMSGVLGSAFAADRAEERALEPWRALDLAAELLAEDVGLAGNAPSALVPTPGAALAVRVVPGGHRLTVRFVDDRLAGPAVARELSFEAGVDGRGHAQLYRASGASSRQPVVEGVGGLVVEWLVDGLGASLGPSAGAFLPGARAVVLRLSAPGGEERAVVIPLPARPDLEVAP